MLRFVIRKMLSKKWMVLSLLIGNILLVSITAGNPMYTRAVLQRTLTRSLTQSLEDTNVYPGLITFRSNRNTSNPAVLREYEALDASMESRFGLPSVENVVYKGSKYAKAKLDMPRGKEDEMSIKVCSLSNLDEHIEIISGDMYSTEPGEDGMIDAIVSERALVESDLLLGDVLTFNTMMTPDGSNMKVRITGVFRNSDAEDLYWVRTPSSFADSCFIDEELFQENFLSGEEMTEMLDVMWYTFLDYTAMRGENVESILRVAEEMAENYDKGSNLIYNDYFTDTLLEYQITAKKVQVTLWVLQAPIFMLLAAFIFMVSTQMLDMEKNEIAVIKSRGAGKSQIFGIYLTQSLLISIIAFAVGLPLGVYLCQMVGSANAFLEFVRRSSLPVEITAEAILFAGVASLLSVCAMVLPAVKHSRVSIVSHKQKKHRGNTPFWQKLCLDLIALGVSLYGLYSFNGQKAALAARVQSGASLDPLLFLSSSLFMVGAGLLAVRIAPAVVWLIYRPFKRLWSPAMYASFLRVLRTRASQGFIMVFLIMTIALGVFNAQAARTINQNAEDNINYTVGADIVVQEYWFSNADVVAQDSTKKLEYTEPDFGRYATLDGAESVTKVLMEKVSVRVDKGNVSNVTLMGIHTKEFGETAWFRDDLSDVHWYHYLNAMSQNTPAVLISRNLAEDYGFKLGDSIYYRNERDAAVRGVVYGIVDYFPGYRPVTYEKDADGLYVERENHLIVAHLAQVQSEWGVTPYQVWIKNRDGADYFYDFVAENEISFRKFVDREAMLIQKKNDPVLQGTNGILTVGFIVVLVLCSVGFLIYWILSIQSRALQFGIFRAMGMSMREVITMLLNEQLFISGLSVAAGAVVGTLTAKLYMPLIQIAYAASDNSLPLMLVSNSQDSVRLFAVVGAVMLACMVILGILISRMKIAQALKLGED